MYMYVVNAYNMASHVKKGELSFRYSINILLCMVVGEHFTGYHYNKACSTKIAKTL